LKSALITGGSSGIGLGLADALLRDGYGVTIVARRAAKLQDAARKLQSLGPVNAFAADLRDEHQIEAATASHESHFGGLDVLVNNAGVALGGPLEETMVKSIDLALAVNLRAALLCTRASVAMLVAAAPSHVFNIASLAGLHGHQGMTTYAASKAGLIAFTDSLRAEFAGRGVKASAICPGFVDTAMSDVVRAVVDESELIPVSDVVEVVTSLLRLSPACVVPTVALEPRAGGLQGWEALMRNGLASSAETGPQPIG
jgi:NAD(P)-dependent dehydrogenase (short-subunit alcohol dehydrogenase family)